MMSGCNWKKWPEVDSQLATACVKFLPAFVNLIFSAGCDGKYSLHVRR